MLKHRGCQKTLVIGLVLFGFLGLCSSLLAQETTRNYLVLGVVYSNNPEAGVALFKAAGTDKTFAIKVGGMIDANAQLISVSRKTINVLVNDKVMMVDVGGDIASSSVYQPSAPARSYVNEVATAVEKDGSTIKVTKALKDQLITTDLEKILMQAAAVPHIVDGRLTGFQLWEIERDSVFDVAGFKNGDIVTAINGQKITDIGMTMRLLTSLREAPQARFDYLRDGSEQNVTVLVQ